MRNSFRAGILVFFVAMQTGAGGAVAATVKSHAQSRILDTLLLGYVDPTRILPPAGYRLEVLDGNAIGTLSGKDASAKLPCKALFSHDSQERQTGVTLWTEQPSPFFGTQGQSISFSLGADETSELLSFSESNSELLAETLDRLSGESARLELRKESGRVTRVTLRSNRISNRIGAAVEWSCLIEPTLPQPREIERRGDAFLSLDQGFSQVITLNLAKLTASANLDGAKGDWSLCVQGTAGTAEVLEYTLKGTLPAAVAEALGLGARADHLTLIHNRIRIAPRWNEEGPQEWSLAILQQDGAVVKSYQGVWRSKTHYANDGVDLREHAPKALYFSMLERLKAPGAMCPKP